MPKVQNMAKKCESPLFKNSYSNIQNLKNVYGFVGVFLTNQERLRHASAAVHGSGATILIYVKFS